MPRNTIADENLTAGSKISFWTDSEKPLITKKLSENLSTDVVIVGGGLAGLSIAYNLSKRGKKIVLVEDGYLGSGETGRTTAHIVNALDDRYYDLEKIYGEDDLKLIAESHSRAIDFIEETILKEKIECEFERVPGYLFLHPSDKPENLTKEFDAVRKAGVDVTWIDKLPGVLTDEGSCIRFNRQAQFHPLKYLKGLSEAIIKNGGLIFTSTHASEIDEKGIVTDDNFKVTAKHVVDLKILLL